MPQSPINLEDIRAPDCLYVERKLRERMKIPVFHDDQDGTAICVGAGAAAPAKPVHILTASATVRRIVNMTALTVADANATRQTHRKSLR